jgi:EAL domain-containing protein (putative c-di-GMP-specific phosphodiesterase class I)
VESKAILDSLAVLGCDCCQGYYISYPLPHERFMAWTDQTRGKT